MIKKTLQYKITEKDQGKTVEQFLRSKGYSHRLVVKLRNSPTGLTIGGELAFTIHRLQAGEILIATLEEENSQNIVPVELPLNIVYEDEDILVVNKDAGVPIHPSQGHFDHTLANAVAWYYQSKGQTLVYRAINRLDRDTTGLLVIAKHLLAGCILSDQMLNRQIHRQYRAIVCGKGCQGEIGNRLACLYTTTGYGMENFARILVRILFYGEKCVFSRLFLMPGQTLLSGI